MNLTFQPAARADIYKQFEYLLKNATPTTALRFRTQIELAAEETARTPLIGTPVFAAGSNLAEVRSWPVPTFPSIRLYYTVETNQIRVLRVLHGKRDVLRILERTHHQS